MGDDGDRAAQGVAVVAGLVDERHHLGLALAVEGAQRRAVVDLEHLLPARRRRVGADRSQRADAAADLDPELGQQHLGEGAGGDPGGALPRRGALEHVAQVAAQVLEAAGEVGVARPGRAHPPELGLGRVDLERVHHRLPVGEVAVLDPQRDRRAQGLAAAHAAADLDLVGLDLHPPAAAVAVHAALHVAPQQVEIDRQAGRHAGQQGGETGTVALAAGHEAQAPHRGAAYQRGRWPEAAAARLPPAGASRGAKASRKGEGMRQGRPSAAATHRCSVRPVASRCPSRCTS